MASVISIESNIEVVLIRRTTVGVQYKLCDFGLSVLHSPTDDASLSYAGTRGFIAPEITMDHADWSAKADVYSFGCTLYYVYERRTPPNDQSSIGLARRTPEPPVRAPPSIQTVVQACLSPSPQSRPDSQELFEEASSHLDETILLLATRHGLDSSHFKSETPLQEQLLSPMSPGSQVHLSKLDSGRSMVDITSSSQSTLRAPPLPPRPRSQNQDSGIKRGALVEYKPSDTDPRTPAKAQETAVDHQVLEALEAEQLEPFPRPLGLFRQFFATRQETLQVKEDNSISEKGFEARTVDGRFLLKLQGDRFALSWRRKVVDAAGNFLFTLRERESTFHTVLSGEDAKGSRIFELRGKGDVRTTRVVGTFVGIGGREESLVMKGDFFDRNAEIRHEQTGLLIAKIKRQGAWKLEFNIAQPIIYRLEVAQNVDMALVVAMCMVLDKRKK
ncbi:kinase-like domain-containing protein [Xylariomycetidae sp. FL2044]|nr:kinase-like domain-containing protein [Xylariomycetidae sp. FL2044]